jgi:uncharacterized iron-regulated membrane protein
MPKFLNIWSRKSHRIGSILIAVPFLLVLVTGILLQLKKDWAWVQPVTQKGTGKEPVISFETMLAAVKQVPEANVTTWADIDRVDVQPKRGLVKVQCANRYEVQLDAATGEVLHVAYRRSDLIESLHDGSFFHDRVRVYVFLPVAVIVLLLLATGVYLFFLPLVVKWRRRKG